MCTLLHCILLHVYSNPLYSIQCVLFSMCILLHVCTLRHAYSNPYALTPSVLYSMRTHSMCTILHVYSTPLYSTPCVLTSSVLYSICTLIQVYTTPCIFNSMYIQLHVYSTPCIFNSMCTLLLAYSTPCVLNSMCTLRYVYMYILLRRGTEAQAREYWTCPRGHWRSLFFGFSSGEPHFLNNFSNKKPLFLFLFNVSLHICEENTIVYKTHFMHNFF